jgi:hypothetical protein
MVVIGVEEDDELISIGPASIPPPQAGDDHTPVVHPPGDVEMVVVEEDPNLSPFGGRGSILGIELDEAIDDRCGTPRLFVGDSVKYERAFNPSCTGYWGRARMVGGLGKSRGTLKGDIAPGNLRPK